MSAGRVARDFARGTATAAAGTNRSDQARTPLHLRKGYCVAGVEASFEHSFRERGRPPVDSARGQRSKPAKAVPQRCLQRHRIANVPVDPTAR